MSSVIKHNYLLLKLIGECFAMPTLIMFLVPIQVSKPLSETSKVGLSSDEAHLKKEKNSICQILSC